MHEKILLHQIDPDQQWYINNIIKMIVLRRIYAYYKYNLKCLKIFVI